MNTGGSCNAYLSLAFSDLTCHLEYTWIGVFLALCCLIARRLNLDVATKRLFFQNGCHLLWQMSSRWGSQKLLQGLVPHKLTAYLSAFDLFLTQRLMAMLSKGCKPDNFESLYKKNLANSLWLTFTNICGLRSNFVECQSFPEPNSPDILALCETDLDDSIDSDKFSVTGYLPISQKNSLFICMVLQLIWRKDFLLHGTYL